MDGLAQQTPSPWHDEEADPGADDAGVDRMCPQTGDEAALEELGYVPIACSGGREALNILSLHPEMDLVITDAPVTVDAPPVAAGGTITGPSGSGTPAPEQEPAPSPAPSPGSGTPARWR